MSIATICLAAAAFMPILCAGLAKQEGFAKGNFDNKNPREWLAKQSGRAARANAAQANSWEALAVFAPAVLTAQVHAAPAGRVDALAVAFIALRAVYVALYLADKASLRSVVWSLGLACSFALFFADAF